MKGFGERIINLLDREGITQRELASLIGVNETTVSRYIAGDREPKPETIANIATILKTTSDYLLGLESDDEEYSFPRIKRLIARNAGNLSDVDKHELIKELLK